jgi:RND superfamily putative drug exporter
MTKIASSSIEDSSASDESSAVRGGAVVAIASWSHDHRKLVLILWLATIVMINVVAGLVGTNFTSTFGGGSSKAQQILATSFPGQSGSVNQVVIVTSDPVTSAANQARTAAMANQLTGLANVATVISPFSPFGSHQVSSDGHVAYIQVSFDHVAGDVPTASIKRVVTVAKSYSEPGFRVVLGGQAIEMVSAGKPGAAEGIGITAAIIIMLLAFGSVVAMGLPIITALFGILVGAAVLDLLSHVVTAPSFAPEVMAMIGLGVGIDYALFIVTRYRQGLAEGRSPREATRASMATSGRSVLFAGTTVILSLLGLFVLKLPFMHGLAIGTIAAVLLVMLAAITVLPAMLGFSGAAIDRLRIPWVAKTTAEPSPRSFWYRWSRAVQHRTGAAGLCALALLVLLALPMFSMHQAFTDAGNDAPGSTTRVAFDTLARAFGPGFNGPLAVAVSVPDGQSAVVERLQDQLTLLDGVAYVSPVFPSSDGQSAVIVVYPTTSPQSRATEQLVHHIRNVTIPAAVSNSGVHAYVGGETAASVDASSYLSSHLPRVIGVVLLLALLLLMAVFRSVAIPIKAVIVNLLSVGAAYGVMVAVFQWGWLGGVFAIGERGPIDPWIPLMMFTILFGLSMDYEVFLLSRIREEWRGHGDSTRAVADGLAKTARVITAAAAIMICVFGSFVIGDSLHVLKVFGLGLAVAVLIDATVVRMVLVPSVMELLGKANWWMPRWLDRIVPHIGVESDVRLPHQVAEPTLDAPVAPGAD